MLGSQPLQGYYLSIKILLNIYWTLLAFWWSIFLSAILVLYSFKSLFLLYHPTLEGKWHIIHLLIHLFGDPSIQYPSNIHPSNIHPLSVHYPSIQYPSIHPFIHSIHIFTDGCLVTLAANFMHQLDSFLVLAQSFHSSWWYQSFICSQFIQTSQVP